MNRKKLLKAVESTASTAAEKGQAALDEAVHRITPYVEQAQDYVGPIARDATKRGLEIAADAYGRVQPALEDAQRRGLEFATDTYSRVQPTLVDAQRRGLDFAADTYERVHPHLHEAKRRGARLAANTLDRFQPSLDEALDRVTPAVEGAVNRVQPLVEDAMSRIAPSVDVARDRIQRDLLPRFSAALHDAAEYPLARQASQRLAEATAALVAELELPSKPKRRVGRTLAKVAIAGAVLAGVIVAVKKLLGPEETGWEAHEPSKPYVADPVADVVDDLTDKAAAAADAVAEATADAVDEGSEVAEQAVEAVTEAADTVGDKAADAVADLVEDGDAAPLAASPDGTGVYVGANPPEGYTIKGNERSRKYHVQGTGGYERTITDVWFESTEAAERAGYVKAQR